MIEDLGDPFDSLCTLRQAKNEIEVLAALEPFPEPAHLQRQRAPAHEQVAHIVDRVEEIRRPVRFEKPVVPSALEVHLVFIGIEHVRARPFIQLLDDFEEREVSEFVVVIQKSDILASAHGKGGVRRSGDAAAGGEGFHLDSRVSLLEVLEKCR